MRMTSPLGVMNHFFFASLLLWFVVQHSALAPSPLTYGSGMVAQALHYQPRLPPPMLDPEQLDTSIAESEAGAEGSALGSTLGSSLGPTLDSVLR